MSTLPPLVGLATAASLADWFLGRGLLRTLAAAEAMPGSQLVFFQQVLLVVRNVAALAGLIALYGTLASWIRYRPFVHLALRITVAGFAGILLPTLALATVLPAERTSPIIVLFAAASTHMLALAMDNVAVHFGGSRTARVASIALALSSSLAFAALTLFIVSRLTLWEAGHAWALRLRPAGELLYFVAMIGLPISTLFWRHQRGRRGAAFAFPLAAALVLGFSYAPRAIGIDQRRTLFYGATHLEEMLSGMPAVYVAALATVIVLAAGAAASSRPAFRARGYASLLLVAAGYSPTTPSSLLMWGLAAMLVSRSLVAEGRPDAGAVDGRGKKTSALEPA